MPFGLSYLSAFRTVPQRAPLESHLISATLSSSQWLLDHSWLGLTGAGRRENGMLDFERGTVCEENRARKGMLWVRGEDVPSLLQTKLWSK